MFWKRAEGYLQLYAWQLDDCYPLSKLPLPRGGVSRRFSLARLAGLDLLPYVPSLLELFQRLGTPAIRPVLYYVLAGAYCGRLQVIDEVSSSQSWLFSAQNPRLPYLPL